MKTLRQNKLIRYVASLAFIIMVTVNALANGLPIAGKDTGAISDAYPNLFAPQGLTFSIWGVIYLLLLFFTLYLVGIIKHEENENKVKMLDKIGLLFIISSLANASWIFAWHYEIIPLSLVLMLVLLVSLILKIKTLATYTLTSKEKFFVRLPFSIYFGWITVATIANVTILLVSLGWNGWMISDTLWTVLVLIVGTLIGLATTLRFKDMAYGLVFIWAYAGIWMKHLKPGPEGFNNAYPSIITTAIIGIVLFALAVIFLFVKRAQSSEK